METTEIDSSGTNHQAPLVRTCSATVASLAVPLFLKTPDKAGSCLPVVGSGAFQYECVHDWLVAPEGLVWGDTHGWCQDAAGAIYVSHTVNKSSMRGEASVVFDEKEKFIRLLGEEFRDYWVASEEYLWHASLGHMTWPVRQRCHPK